MILDIAINMGLVSPSLKQKAITLFQKGGELGEGHCYIALGFLFGGKRAIRTGF